jgi:hypothetical protein
MNVDQSRLINKLSINTTVWPLDSHLNLAKRCCGFTNEVVRSADSDVQLLEPYILVVVVS